MADEKAWPPGFRFHPTDEELVLYYLKRKICRRKIDLDIIAETDVYKWDPEELPGLSLLKTGDRQWFFFSPRDRKYPNGARANRATRQGYWKATGKDRIVTCNSRNVGVKKTLVFYKGRAPSGSRTDWVMHEYTLDEEEFKRCRNVKDYYALYKVFKKSGPGPKNGEQYGAPFKEEDWADVECRDFNNFDDQEIPMKQVNEVSSVANVRESVESLLSFDVIDDQEIPMKQLNEVSSGANVRESVESLLSFHDIEELMKQIPDEPVFDFLDGHDNPYSTSQALVQEAEKSTVVDPCSQDLIFPKPEEILHSSVLLCGVQGSFNLTNSNISMVDSYEGPDISSTHAPNFYEELELLIEEDFLEIDDLLDTEPATLATEKPADNLLVENLDGFGEFDMFHDASLFLHELESDNLGFGHPNHGAVAELYLNGQNSPVNQVFQLQSDMNFPSQSSDPLWIGDQPSSNFNVPEPYHAYISQPPPDIPCESFHPTPKVIQTQGNEGRNDGGAVSRFSSSLWAFVESIPTTPASAAENKLVHLAFERMSSFKKLKINPRNTQIATRNAAEYKRGTGKVRGFVFISMIIAFSAIFLAMIGGFGRTRSWILTL